MPTSTLWCDVGTCDPWRYKSGEIPELMEKTSVYDRIFPYLIVGLVFFIQGVEGFYAIYEMAPPGAFVLLSYLTLFWIIGDWFLKDSRKNKIEWVYDMGFLLYLFWPVFIPFYLFKTRGLKIAFLRTFGFVVLYLGAYFLSYHALYSIAP